MSVPEDKLKRFWRELVRRRVVRVALFYAAGAWVLVQVADIVFEAFDLDHLLKYAIATAAAGLPVALVLSWMFDLTPQGIERTPDVEEKDGEIPSIAVLPFANISGDPSNEYFSDGLTEEIRDQLARVPGLRVAARTSSFAFKGKHEDAREISRRLDVRLLLEGGVRKHADTVRISAQLVDARRGFQVWAESYERQLADVFQIQSEISRAILEAVQVKLIQHHVTRQQTRDFEAYNCYLLGRHHFHRRSEQSLNRALEYFRRAIAIDANFAAAYSGLADAACLLSTSFYGNLKADEAVAMALPAARRALEIDPASAEAHASMGLIGHTQRDYEAGNRSLERAIGLDPDYALAHVWFGMTLIAQGRYREAAMRNAEALRLDPLSPIVNANAGFDALRFGDYREAEARFAAAIELDPEFPVPYSGMGRLYTRRGDLDQAFVWVDRAVELAPTRSLYLGRKGFLYLQLGQLERAAEWLDAARHHAGNPRFVSDAWLGLSIAADDHEHLRQIVDGAPGFDATQRGLAAWVLGDPGQALARYREDCPDYARLVQNMVNDDWLWRFPHSLHLAALRLLRGEAGAREDLGALLERLDETRRSGLVYADTHYWSAAALAALDRHEEALAQLDQAIKTGWRAAWWARRDPNLAAMRQQPGFANLLARVDRLIAHSAEKVERAQRG